MGRIHSNCNIFTRNVEHTLGDVSGRDDKILNHITVTDRRQIQFKNVSKNDNERREEQAPKPNPFLILAFTALETGPIR